MSHSKRALTTLACLLYGALVAHLLPQVWVIPVCLLTSIVLAAFMHRSNK
jgi:uncharacterized membrane protein YccC